MDNEFLPPKIHRPFKAGRQNRHRNRRLARPFSNEETNILISVYAQHEVLWNSKSDLRKNKNITRRLKESIAEQINHNVSDVNLQWNNLKTRFNREKKRKQYNAMYRPTWKYFDVMSFVKDDNMELGNSYFEEPENNDFRQLENNEFTQPDNNDFSHMPTIEFCNTVLSAQSGISESSHSEPELYTESVQNRENATNIEHKKKRKEMCSLKFSKTAQTPMSTQSVPTFRDNQWPQFINDEWTQYGMFIATELRSRSRHTALRMKRALIQVTLDEQFNEDDLCMNDRKTTNYNSIDPFKINETTENSFQQINQQNEMNELVIENNRVKQELEDADED